MRYGIISVDVIDLEPGDVYHILNWYASEEDACRAHGIAFVGAYGFSGKAAEEVAGCWTRQGEQKTIIRQEV